jgi:hypothetical protein
MQFQAAKRLMGEIAEYAASNGLKFLTLTGT